MIVPNTDFFVKTFADISIKTSTSTTTRLIVLFKRATWYQGYLTAIYLRKTFTFSCQGFLKMTIVFKKIETLHVARLI